MRQLIRHRETFRTKHAPHCAVDYVMLVKLSASSSMVAAENYKLGKDAPHQLEVKSMNKLSVIIAGAAIMGFAGWAGGASAAQPENPGCFGQDRAAILQALFIGNKDGTLADGSELTATDDGEPGASRWGGIAGDRAETNGEMNRAYKEGCGGGQPD
jgi:hypothetical protein